MKWVSRITVTVMLLITAALIAYVVAGIATQPVTPTLTHQEPLQGGRAGHYQEWSDGITIHVSPDGWATASDGEEIITEEDPRWSCERMGNRLCGGVTD